MTASWKGPEHTVHVTLFRWLRDVVPDAVVFTVENETRIRDKAETVQLAILSARKAKGVRAGVSDLIVLLPGKRCFLLEVKAPREGTLSDHQQRFEEDVTAIGHDYAVADSIETARWALHQAGIGTREAAGQPMHPWNGRRAKVARVQDDQVPF